MLSQECPSFARSASDFACATPDKSEGRQAHHEPTLMIDRCVRGDGLWFDKGELNNIIARAELDEGNKIKQLLADMFGGRE